MNLKEFLAYRTYCPICDSILMTSLFSTSKKYTSHTENEVVVFHTLRNLDGKRYTDQSISYHFNKNDNSYYIDYYDSNQDLKSNIHLSSLEKFKELNHNRNKIGYDFYKYCTECERYNYASKAFKLDLTKNTIDDLSIRAEFFGLSKKVENGYKVYRLLNIDNKSHLVYGIFETDHQASIKSAISAKSSTLETGLIKFTNKDDTLERISKLLLFS
jgi:hypothetical protein